MLTRWRCGKSLATRHLLDRWTRRHQEAFVHTSPHRASALPWDWLQGRRKLAEHTVNKFHFDRARSLGPDLACLEWLMNCGATEVLMSDGTAIKSRKEMRAFISALGFDLKSKTQSVLCDVKHIAPKDVGPIILNNTRYDERWKNAPKVYIRSVDASDSAIADPGFEYFLECRHIEKLVANFCDYFGDRALLTLGYARAQQTLGELEIVLNPHISDGAFFHITRLRALQRAHFYFNPYVRSESIAIQRVRNAVPRCYITYPQVKYVGLGK